DGGFGDPAEAAIAALQIVDRARNHVPDSDRLPGFGVGDQALVGEGVLAVEDAGEGFGGAGQRRMRGDVVHPCAVEPQLRPGRPETLEELLARSRTHFFASTTTWR